MFVSSSVQKQVFGASRDVQPLVYEVKPTAREYKLSRHELVLHRTLPEEQARIVVLPHNNEGCCIFRANSAFTALTIFLGSSRCCAVTAHFRYHVVILLYLITIGDFRVICTRAVLSSGLSTCEPAVGERNLPAAGNSIKTTEVKRGLGDGLSGF